jgi:signal transduction histidine kinase
MKFGIRQKLFSGFVIIMLLFTGTCAVGLWSIQRIVDSLKRTLEHPMVVNHTSQDIKVLVLSMQRDMYGISMIRDPAFLEQKITEIRNKEKEALEAFYLIQKQILGNNGKMLSLRTRILFYHWKPVRDKAIGLARKGLYDQAHAITLSDGDSVVLTLEKELDKISDYSMNKAKMLTEESVGLANRTLILELSTVVLSILISLFISFYLSLSITRRLKLISSATTLMMKGNLHQSLEIRGHDELTQVAGNFNIMASELAGMYEDLEKKVVERTRKLEEANEELNRVKGELESKMNERTQDLEEKISELNRSQLAMLYMIEDMNETSRQLKATQEELIQKERLAILGQFSGNISHELRNPLGVIDSSIYYLQMRITEKDQKVREHLDRISQSVRNATIIIENLLNLTRMNKPVLTRYSIVSLLTECLKTCKIPEGVTFIEDYPETEVWVKAEKEQIRMAVDNLVKNAVAAMNGNGILTLRVRRTKDSEAEISFIDTGSGINPEHLNQVFLPLFSTKAKGIGLGLSITKMIVENHGAKITAEAEPGQGARFSIRFPRINEDPPEEKSIQTKDS